LLALIKRESEDEEDCNNHDGDDDRDKMGRRKMRRKGRERRTMTHRTAGVTTSTYQLEKGLCKRRRERDKKKRRENEELKRGEGAKKDSKWRVRTSEVKIVSKEEE
jgi:hypothetical protein